PPPPPPARRHAAGGAMGRSGRAHRRRPAARGGGRRDADQDQARHPRAAGTAFLSRQENTENESGDRQDARRYGTAVAGSPSRTPSPPPRRGGAAAPRLHASGTRPVPGPNPATA